MMESQPILFHLMLKQGFNWQGDMTGNANKEELSEAEKRLQQEEEKYGLYRRVYVGQLSNEEESDMDSDGSTYSFYMKI